MGLEGAENNEYLDTESNDTFNTEFVSEPNDYEDMKYNYDTAIVVLSGGIVEGYNDAPKIPSRARMRMFAAIDIYDKEVKEGKKPVIILSGGVPSPTEDDYTEASFMGYMLVTHYNIPVGDIIVEQYSYDTPTNAKYTNGILRELGFKEQGNVKLITNGFHLARSKELFEKYYGGEFEAIDAEKYLYENHPDRYMLPGDQMAHPYGLFARKFESSRKNKILKVIDTTLRYISKVGLGEMVLGELAKRSRMKKEITKQKKRLERQSK